MQSRSRAALSGVATWLLVLATLRVSVALPERCPPVTAAEVDAAVGAAVGWLVANQDDDGSFAYRVARRTGQRQGGYSPVRHAGVALALYQASERADGQAWRAAEHALGWAQARLFEHDGWAALRGRGRRLPTGGSALLLAALAERRTVSGDTSLDPLMRRLGRFLATNVERDGGVLAFWDPATGAPVPDDRSVFSTGEVFWALARLHTADPTGRWGAHARRIGHYLATARDREERRIPPVHDHWAAYGLEEVGRQWSEPRLEPPAAAYAERLAGYLATAARFQSKDGPDVLERAVDGPPRGSALGTTGEGLAALARLTRSDPRLGHLADGLDDRLICIAGLLVAGQTTAADTADSEHTERVAGAWFVRGVTRMDDQQHALSALLAARPAVARVRGGT